MRWRRLLLLFSIALCTARCGTLFNQQRSDTATSAQKKFSDVKLADLLAEERKHNAQVLAREIEIAQRQMTAARDAKLIAMLSSGRDLKTELTEAIDERMKLLQATDTTIAALLTRIEKQENALRTDAAVYLIARKPRDPKPDCTPATSVSEGAKEYFELVQKDCEVLAKSRADLVNHTNAGLLGSTAHAIAAAEHARIDIATRIKAAEQEADKVLKNVANAQQKAGDGAIAAALGHLKTNLDTLKLAAAEDVGGIGLDDARLAAALRWTELQKAAVEKILGAATSGGAPPADLASELQLVATVPALAEQLRAGLQYPRVSALVMEAQRLRIEADRYRRQLARVDEELELQRAKLRRLRGERFLLAEAASNLLPQSTNVDVALQKYTESWTGGRIPLTAIEWKLIGLTHDRALDQSEAAIAQWEGLVRVPLEALVASAGSGLKPEEIARLLQTLEMSALAAGVF